MERTSGHQVGSIPASEFRRLLAEEIDLRTFTTRRKSPPEAAGA
jgi:hypothetical protein